MPIAILIGAGVLGLWGFRSWRSHLQKRDLRKPTITPLVMVNTTDEPDLSFFVDGVLAAENVPLFKKELVNNGSASVLLYSGKHTIVAKNRSGDEVSRIDIDVPTLGWNGAIYTPLRSGKICFVLHVDHYADVRAAEPPPRDEIPMPADTELWFMPRQVNNWFEPDPRLIQVRVKKKPFGEGTYHAAEREMAAVRAVSCESP
jgi:hypothetical protein